MSATVTTTSVRRRPLREYRDRTVRRRVAQRVREQVHQHPLHVRRRAAHVGQPVVDARLEPHAAGQRLGLQSAQAALDHRMQRGLAVRLRPLSRRAAPARTGRRSALPSPVPGHGSRARSARPAPARRRPPRASPASPRAACAGRGWPRRPAPGERRTAARGSPPSRSRAAPDRRTRRCELAGARRSSRPAASPSAVARTGARPPVTDRANSSAPITAAVDDAAATPRIGEVVVGVEHHGARQQHQHQRHQRHRDCANTTSCQRSVGSRARQQRHHDAQHERDSDCDDGDVDHGTSR